MLFSRKLYVLCISVALLLAPGCVPREDCRVFLYGVVTDVATGSGIAGAEVSIDGVPGSCESLPDGSYATDSLTMKPGRLSLSFEKEGYGTAAREVAVSRSGSIRVDASLFASSEGEELVRFRFTAVNDYEPGPVPSSMTPYRTSSAPREIIQDAVAVVAYPKRGAPFSEAAEALRRLGGKVLGSDPSMGYLLIGVPEGVSPDEYAKLISEEAWADGAEPDYVCYPTGGYVPDDPLWPLQWAPRSISMHRAWRLRLPQAAVIIAVVDTGVDVMHPDLAGRCLPMMNSINTDMSDNDGHGTHVAGIAGASLDNGIGISGIAPSAIILPVKAMDKRGLITSGTMSSISRGIRLAADNGAAVINLSLGWPLIYSDCMFRLLKEAIDYADSMGIAVIAASGNNGSATDIIMPAKYHRCFSVSAVTPRLEVAPYANTGPGTDLFAPGGGGGAEGVLSSVPFHVSPSGYARMTGTSMATPHVSALFAVLISSGMSAEEAAEEIIATSQYVEGQDAGLLNAYTALAGARGGRALFWLCDDDGEPLTYAFRGSDGSRDASVWGGYGGHAWLCGWIPVAGEDYPAHGDFFGMEEVLIAPGEALELPGTLRLAFVDLEDASSVRALRVPEILEDN